MSQSPERTFPWPMCGRFTSGRPAGPAAGLVAEAGSTPALAVKSSAPGVVREYMTGYRAESKAKASCIECAQPVCPESKTRCARHHVANPEPSVRHSQQKLAGGICRNCSQAWKRPAGITAPSTGRADARTRAYMQRKRQLKKAQKVIAMEAA